MIIKAYFRTRNFEFEGFGKTEKQAREALERGLIRHSEQYHLPTDWYLEPDWHYKSCVEIYKFEFGCSYRDGSELLV